MAQHRKANGSITIQGRDGKIAGNVPGAALNGPSASRATVDAPAAPPRPESYDVVRVLAVATDTALAELYAERWGVRAGLATKFDSLHYTMGDKRDWKGRWPRTDEDVELEARALVDSDVDDPRAAYRVRDARVALDAIDAARDALDDIARRQAPLDEEFEAHRWTRAFLVVGGTDGHVHKTMACHTCFPTTEFHWLPEYSGADETAIVQDAGERACTICFPTAPADILNQPTKIFSADEKRKAVERVARAEAKKERDQAKVAKAATPDGSELVVVIERGIAPSHWRNAGQPYEKKESFKTERSAISWATDALMWADWREREGRTGLSEAESDAIDAICESLAAKHGKTPTDIRADIDKKAAAKIRKG